MNKLILGVLASLAVATPALADEARVEARGGIVWTSGATQDVYGAAAGYDWDLGPSTFGGLEVSADKIGASGLGLNIGATGRFGIKAGPKTKIFVDGGYTVNTCVGCDDSFHAGGGVEVGLAPKVYGKLGYRHYFRSSGAQDYNAAVVGIGLRF